MRAIKKFAFCAILTLALSLAQSISYAYDVSFVIGWTSVNIDGNIYSPVQVGCQGANDSIIYIDSEFAVCRNASFPPLVCAVERNNPNNSYCTQVGNMTGMYYYIGRNWKDGKIYVGGNNSGNGGFFDINTKTWTTSGSFGGFITNSVNGKSAYTDRIGGGLLYVYENGEQKGVVSGFPWTYSPIAYLGESLCRINIVEPNAVIACENGKEVTLPMYEAMNIWSTTDGTIYATSNTNKVYSIKQDGTYTVSFIEGTFTGQQVGVFSKINTPPTPPPTPVQSVIDGLACEEVIIPDPNNAVWNSDFGKLPLYATSSGTEANGEKYIQTTSVSNDRRSFDAVRLQNIGDGSDLPIGAMQYPGTDYANVNLNDSADTSIVVLSKRDGALAKWNLLQFHGVNQQGFQAWSASTVVRIGDSYLEGQGLSATGGVATLGIAGNNLATTASIYTPVSGFQGIRIGYATPTKKRYCSAQSNKCEWSYEGDSLLCQGVPTADGLISGACGIAGSGSVYGSGACVPLTNASGAIVEVDLPGSYTIVKNPDGTTTKVKAGEVGSAGSIFSCRITGESWYERIGQYIACPFTQILPNVWNYMTSPVKDLSKGATAISTSGSGGIGLVGTGAQQSDNQVILSIKNAIEAWTGDNQHPINRYVFLVVALVGILVIVAMVALFVSVIRD